MEKQCYVYIYLDPRYKDEYVYGEYKFEFKPFYVGQGRGRRCKKHLLEAKKDKDMGNSFKFNTIKKILSEGLEPIIIKIYENIDEKEAKKKEIEIIDIIGRKDNGGILTNMTNGGDGTSGYIVPDERRKQMSEIAKGKTHTEEHKKYMSSLMSGRKLSDETKKKISEAKKGTIISEKTKKLWSEQRKGKNHPNYGKTFSEETKKKMSEAKKGRIVSKDEREYRSKIMTNLLVGEKNPMYGMTGSKNPNAKKYLLISPDGLEIFIHGTLRQMLRELNLTESLLREAMKTNKACEKKGKTFGWQMKIL